MEINGQDGLNFKIDQKNQIASVIKSPKAKGSVLIPRFVVDKDIKYKVTSIEEDAFSNNKIQSLLFPPDSEVIIFNKKAFHCASIEKLQIPASLTAIEKDCFFLINDLVDIEVSPKNHLFSYVENKFLLGKKNEKQTEFDELIYARFDLKTAKIPPYIKILKSYSINKNLKSLIFPENSVIEEIECGALSGNLTKLTIPKTLKKIDDSCFNFTYNLVDVEVSPENEVFSYVDDKYLLIKSDGKNFDELIFCSRDAKNAIIRNYIKKIGSNSFNRCKQLESITFESKSSLEEIKSYAFYDSNCPSEVIIPESVSKVGRFAFCKNRKLEHIQFLGEDVTIDTSCFFQCENLLSVSFPNAKRVSFNVFSISEKAKIFVRKDAKLIGSIATKFKNQVEFIKEATNKKSTPKPKSSKQISIEQENYDKIVNYVRELENELSSYKKITPFNFTTFQGGTIKSNKEKTEELESNSFIESDDDKRFETIEKVYEGSKSILFKIIDHKTSNILCKKVLKIDQERISFKDAQNSIKEFEVLHMINHPCICKCKFINISEKDEHSELTTISIYIEYLDYKLENLLQSEIVNNTMKVKIAVEIALGMSELHKRGMIHRDLNINHIMLNSIFETKIIDFGMVKVNDLLNDEIDQSLTKKIGLLAFMSPEMANEDDYDNKTDVYSYGIILYVIFSDKDIDQTMKGIMKMKRKIKLPKPSYSISKNCIELIQKCISNDPKERPSFEEIIEIMKLNHFSLASDVDQGIINRRIDEINRQISNSPQNNK